MPIIDIQPVVAGGAAAADAAAIQRLADAIGRVLGSAPGRTWLRLQPLPAAHYAENDSALAGDELPVFVTVLHAQPPTGAALAREVAALTSVVAAELGCAPSRVHVQYAPAAAGRQAFGGSMVE